MMRAQLALGTMVAFGVACSDGSGVPAWGVESRVQTEEPGGELLVNQAQLSAGTQPAAPRRPLPPPGSPLLLPTGLMSP